jgi:recombination protein RecA
MSKKRRVDLSSEKAIQKEFGTVISSGSELIDSKKGYKTLSVSPALDLGLNGGILEGTWTVISGNPKTGKTTTVLQICQNAQDEGRPVIYVDVESRLKTYNLQGIDKLNLDNIQIIHGPHDENQILSAEKFLKITESVISMPKNKGAVCILDSTSSLVPEAELEEDPSATLRASLPKLLSHWVKKNAQIVVRNKIIFIAITHYITNTSGYGKVKIADGGVQLQYQADTKLDVVRSEDWLEGGDSGRKIGQKINWKIGCSSLGASGAECTSYLKYGKGIDKHQEIIELATSLGIIEKSGSWFAMNFLDDPVKLQGLHKVYAFLEEKPDIFQVVVTKVKEMME